MKKVTDLEAPISFYFSVSWNYVTIKWLSVLLVVWLLSPSPKPLDFAFRCWGSLEQDLWKQILPVTSISFLCLLRHPWEILVNRIQDSANVSKLDKWTDNFIFIRPTFHVFKNYKVFGSPTISMNMYCQMYSASIFCKCFACFVNLFWNTCSLGIPRATSVFPTGRTAN